MSRTSIEQTETTPARDRRPAAFTLLVLLVLVGPAAAASWLPRANPRSCAASVEERHVDPCARPVAADANAGTRPMAGARGRPGATGSCRARPGSYFWPPARAPDRASRVR